MSPLEKQDVTTVEKRNVLGYQKIYNLTVNNLANNPRLKHLLTIYVMNTDLPSSGRQPGIVHLDSSRS